MAQSTVHSYDRLTDETVEILCHAAKEKSARMGLDISFAVCDAGGLPLFRDGKIVGAIGVGGGTKEQDLEIAGFVVAKFNEMNAE